MRQKLMSDAPLTSTSTGGVSGTLFLVEMPVIKACYGRNFRLDLEPSLFDTKCSIFFCKSSAFCKFSGFQKTFLQMIFQTLDFVFFIKARLRENNFRDREPINFHIYTIMLKFSII